MWVKLDKDNYYTNCYCESNDPKINPFEPGAKGAFMTLPPHLGADQNKCYKLITNSCGGFEWYYDGAKYNALYTQTPEGKLAAMNERMIDLTNIIVKLM